VRQHRAWLVVYVLLFVAFALAQQSHYAHHGFVALPDAHYTPGEVRTIDVNEVCHGGSTKQYRHTTSDEKKRVCVMYGVAHCPWEGHEELDHLIPLELGGADTVANLWVQMAEPRPGYHEKDALENFLHNQVCDGKMALVDAQAAIRTDWYAAYLAMKQHQ
jgi:hypothetical protein